MGLRERFLNKSVDRSSDAYDRGKYAFSLKIKTRDCPFFSGQERIDWFAGWYDAHFDAKYASLPERWKL